MLLILATLLACSDDETPADSSPTTSTADTAVSIDTGWAPGDYAAFQIWTNMNDGLTRAGAIAVQTTPGYINLVECIADPSNNTTCLPQLPKADGTFIDFDPDERVDLELLRTRYLGSEVSYGPFPLTVTQEEVSQAVYYTGPANFAAIINDSFGPEWGEGFWPPYQGTEDITVTSPIQIISPEPGSFNQFTSGRPFVIEWVPRGDGNGVVTLEVTSRFGFARIYRLADDGLFALDVDDLPWGSIVQDVEFKLTRWDRGELRRFGHVIDLLATSFVTFEGQYLNVGVSEPLEPANSCNPALGLLSLPAGDWWWPTDEATNNVGNCGAPGPDVIYRVDLPSRTLLTVEYNHYGEDVDAVLGIATACPVTEAEQCPELVNQFGAGDPEFARYFNITDRTESVYVFADMLAPPFIPEVPEPVFMTIQPQIQEVQSPELYNTCSDVPAGVTLAPGVYYSEFTAFSGTLNPGQGGCTMKGAPGPEALVPITVPPNQTATIGIEMPGGDPGIYLLTNCNDAFTCVAGADTGADPDEELVYVNNTGTPQNLFLVVDSADGLRPYFLSVNFN